jgi:hypothetical protein
MVRLFLNKKSLNSLKMSDTSIKFILSSGDYELVKEKYDVNDEIMQNFGIFSSKLCIKDKEYVIIDEVVLL